MTSAVVNHLWESTLFAAGIGLITLLLRRHRASLRYCLWLIASVKFLVPFALLSVLVSRLLPMEAQPQVVTGWYTAIEPVIRPVPETTAEPSLWIAVAAVWAAGFAVIVMHWIWRQARWRAVLRRAESRDEKPAGAAEQNVNSVPGRTAGCGYSGVTLRYTREPVGPALVGAVRPVLLLPEALASRLTPAEFDAVIAHELCHHKRLDNLTASLHRLVEALFWFHPLVWWIGARLIEERERACDEAVVGAGYEADIYAEGLLKVCELGLRSPAPAAAGVVGGDLKRRVIGIMNSDGLKELRVMNRVMLLSAVIALVVVPVLAGTVARSQDAPDEGVLPVSRDAPDEEFVPVLRIAPRYPERAWQQRLEGWVTVEFTVIETGQVRDVVVVDSSNRMFEQSAVDAASQFQFVPRVEDGVAVEVPGVRNMFWFRMSPEETQ